MFGLDGQRRYASYQARTSSTVTAIDSASTFEWSNAQTTVETSGRSIATHVYDGNRRASQRNSSIRRRCSRSSVGQSNSVRFDAAISTEPGR